LAGAVEALDNAEEEPGWTVRAPPVSAEAWPDAEVLGASQEHHTTVAPGLRGSTTPAALSPVWLEQPERRAAWARRPVVGVLGSSLFLRQGRLYLQTHVQGVWVVSQKWRWTAMAVTLGLILVASLKRLV